MPLPRHLTY